MLNEYQYENAIELSDSKGKTLQTDLNDSIQLSTRCNVISDTVIKAI
jgi:hypothetical protein